MVSEVVSEMEYLRSREQKLRDTNESTNERVKWFAFGTMGMLVGLGVWQVIYLRAYFRFVPLLFFSFLSSFPSGPVQAAINILQIQASHLDEDYTHLAFGWRLKEWLITSGVRCIDGVFTLVWLGALCSSDILHGTLFQYL